MPLAVPPASQYSDTPYFETLEELDVWAKVPSAKLDGLVNFCPRRSLSNTPSGNHGKLLVCHDYKGGYTESPATRSYTFNFWSLCDTFVYFSHHRVTVPPPGWISAAHRQGVKMLGTLIFEGSGEEDCLRLLVGHLPKSKTGPAAPFNLPSLPLSPHYARVLADLAHQRGFDGYLLNVECHLRGGLEQTRALSAWICLLQAELHRKVGAHAQTIWYDSVIISGRLAWQDRLNSLNLPFFLSSTSIFTNYTWQRDYPSLTAQYFLTLDPSLTGDNEAAASAKYLSDIFMGVDVWGRGSHGGGGLGSYRAISHIAPESLGLSVALFGQAWTWESEQDKPGWSWESWWAYERMLWVGPAGDEPVEVPEAPRREGEPECLHGPFLSIRAFFTGVPPPDPATLAFHTTFCPGTGLAWFVGGAKVFERAHGWTDIDKQCSVGDLVWPRPHLAWEAENNITREDATPDASAALCLDDAWNGGSSLRLSLSCAASDAEDAFFRCVWLPVQSLAISSQTTYEAAVIYKLDTVAGVELDIGLSVKLATPGEHLGYTIQVNPSAIGISELASGWVQLNIQFSLSSNSVSLPLPKIGATAAIGLVVAIIAEDPSQPADFSVLLGQLNVFPTPPLSAPNLTPIALWADFVPSSNHPADIKGAGILSWDVAAAFPSLTSVSITSPEDPIPAWTLDGSEAWFPTFLYFNIYRQAHAPDGSIPGPQGAIWIGTSGLDGHANRFPVEGQHLTDEERNKGIKGYRLYVQGLTSHGELLPWSQCVFVDVQGDT